MNKTDLLLIRACKSFDPYKRVDSFMRRFFHKSWQHEDLVCILESISREYFPIKTIDLIKALHPDNAWQSGIEPALAHVYWYRVSKVLISHVRLSDVYKIKGYVPPITFRR